MTDQFKIAFPPVNSLVMVLYFTFLLRRNGRIVYLTYYPMLDILMHQ